MNCLIFCVHIFLILSVTKVIWAANILYISTTASPSHNIWDKTLALALHQRHHNITFFTHAPEKSFENFTTIILEGVYEKLHEDFVYEDLNMLGPLESCGMLYDWISKVAQYDAETEGLQTLIKQANDGVKYDIILFDLTTGHFLYPIIEKFNSPPVVATSPFGLIPYFTYSFGIDYHSSYIPLWMMEYTDQMTFFERVHNYFLTMYFLFIRQFIYMPTAKLLAENVFGENIGSLDKIEKNFSILLTNSDPLFDYPVPVPPAVIHVGGLHTKREKNLPEDLLLYMNNSKHGIILFSLGSNIRSDKIGIKQRQAMIQAFAKLKQNILWKFESDIEDLPENVKISKWLPQNDILAHPNMRLFITHGGGLSTQEAVFHGVPVVGIPFFADQHVNMHKMVVRKLGLKLDYKHLTSKIVSETLNEVIENPIYMKNMNTLSKRYRDQPQDPLERAVFWVEYVLRHGGAQHLRIAARDMPWYQIYYLDMWFLFILTIIFVRLIIIRILSKKKSRKQHSKVKTK